MNKIVLCVAMVAFMLASMGYAAEVTLTWDPNSEADLAGYRIYMTTAQGEYAYKQANPDTPNLVWEGTLDDPVKLPDPQNPTAKVAIPNDCRDYWFVGTAFDLCGNESLPSNEVHFKDIYAPCRPAGFSRADLN